ncbi:MAG: nuclear transport factor 2 family protein, partial [Gemmatimonadetes bacterium]|nr:nuclear transport factor 2 family protein [Gemmatimonadota bacterium]
LDYIEGYYAGAATRMERALHPDLAKRIVRAGPSGGPGALENMSAMTLVLITRSMAQSPVPPEARRADVTILDVFGNAASVRVDAAQWVDYLHLGRFNGQWRIVNVLWEMRPGGAR